MIEFCKFLLRVVLGVFYKVELYGRENIPESGGLILCSNHLAELDMLFIGYRIKRHVRWMAKEELFRFPPIGAFLKSLGAYPIKRGKGDIDSIKTTLKLLEEGNIVGIFPEGTRTLGKKDKKITVKRGAALIAQKANVPILPVAIKSDYRLFGRVRVIFGKPFMLDLDKEKKYTSEEMTEISKGIMDKIYSLMEENQVGNNPC
ncbi:MAG: 1-acyl-sn-glycerol-3-phosphate acyltransferase [Clostridia bacterium]|nr:1-acyl-sn-glycerol-3-phosphate acyltransferase [Clostridia bacterium]